MTDETPPLTFKWPDGAFIRTEFRLATIYDGAGNLLAEIDLPQDMADGDTLTLPDIKITAI